MAIAGLAREGSGYAMAIVFAALDAHDVMAITEGARIAITQRARQQQVAVFLMEALPFPSRLEKVFALILGFSGKAAMCQVIDEARATLPFPILTFVRTTTGQIINGVHYARTDEKDCLGAVEKAIDRACIIVVHAPATTGNVDKEIDMLIDPNPRQRSVFVVGDLGECHALERYRVLFGQRIRATYLHQLRPTLEEMLHELAKSEIPPPAPPEVQARMTGQGFWSSSRRLDYELARLGVMDISFRFASWHAVQFEVYKGRAAPADSVIAQILKCVVGLTLPTIVDGIGTLRLCGHSYDVYAVRLGDGVIRPAFMVLVGDNVAGPFQVSANEQAPPGVVRLTPLIASNDQVWIARRAHVQLQLWYLLRPTLEEMRGSLFTPGRSCWQASQ